MQFHLIGTPRATIDLSGELVRVSVPLSQVEWDREVAVIVDMGEQRSAGFGVKVTGISLPSADELHLEVEVSRPGPGQFVAQVLTHPYAVVTVPRVTLRTGDVTLVAHDRTGAEVARQAVQW